MSAATKTRLALAIIAACTAATSLYAILRVVQKLSGTEPDPALVLYSEHAGYYWRAWIASYGGAMTGFVTYLIAGRHPERTLRILSAAVIAAAVLITAQGILVP